jgi:hypothetical protein
MSWISGRERNVCVRQGVQTDSRAPLIFDPVDTGREARFYEHCTEPSRFIIASTFFIGYVTMNSLKKTMCYGINDSVMHSSREN